MDTLVRLILLCLLSSVTVVNAVPVFAEILPGSSWKFSGGISGTLEYLSYRTDRQGRFDFDTLKGGFEYEWGAVTGTGKIRFYRYPQWKTGGDPGELVFLQNLWAGYRFADASILIAGLDSQPFGLYPFTGNNSFESIAYYAGYEDTQSLGFKYARKNDRLELQLAFYPNDGGHGWANATAGNFLETESARYSFHAVKGNTERNTAVARTAWHLDKSAGHETEIGLSWLNGEISSNIGQAGWREAAAAHYAATVGKLEIRLQAMRYQYRLNGAPDTLWIGAYGFSNRLAARGNLYIANFSYKLDGRLGPLHDLVVYHDFSTLQKSVVSFVNSTENVTGLSYSAGDWSGVVEWLQGTNSSYMSPVFTDGMGSGATVNNTGSRLNINAGYHF